MIHNYYLKYKNIELRPLDEEHIEDLRVWRNDKEQTKYLRQIGHISPEMQKSWFENYKTDKDIIAFAIYETETLNKIVGSVSLYNFRDNIIEFGKFQIGSPDAHGRGIGKIATIMACKMGFVLGAKKIDASVHVDNAPAKSIYYGIGFKKVGEKLSPSYGMEDIIELTEETLVSNKIVEEIEFICDEKN